MSDDDPFARLESLTLPEFDADAVSFHRPQWGETAFRVEGLPDHLVIETRRAPDGLLFVGVCTACGGRAERLVDLPALLEQATAGSDADAMGGPDELMQAEGVRATIDAAIHEAGEALTTDWMPVHEECATDPHEPPFPAEAESFADGLLTQLAERLDAGEPVSPHLVLLFANDVPHVVAVPELPSVEEDLEERRIRSSVFRHRVRRALLERGLVPLAALFVTEAWMRSSDPAEATTRTSRQAAPDGQRALLATLTTAAAGRMGYALIAEAFGEAGGATVGEMSWQPLVSPHRFVDGLLVRADRS